MNYLKYTPINRTSTRQTEVKRKWSIKWFKSGKLAQNDLLVWDGKKVVINILIILSIKNNLAILEHACDTKTYYLILLTTLFTWYHVHHFNLVWYLVSVKLCLTHRIYWPFIVYLLLLYARRLCNILLIFFSFAIFNSVLFYCTRTAICKATLFELAIESNLIQNS